MGRKKKEKITLTENEAQALRDFVKCGKKSAREIIRARALLLDSEGKSDIEIAKILEIRRETVWSIRQKVSVNRSKGILESLKDNPRSGKPIRVDDRVKANVTMIACSTPPEGRARWTLRLIADKVVKLSIIDSISPKSVSRVLKKTS